MKLRLRGTFIDCLDGEAKSPSPRALSEPPLSVARPSILFECEQTYIEHLASRGSAGCSPLPKKRIHCKASPPRSTHSGLRERKAAPGSEGGDEDRRDPMRARSYDEEVAPDFDNEETPWVSMRRRTLDEQIRSACSPPTRTLYSLGEGSRSPGEAHRSLGEANRSPRRSLGEGNRSPGGARSSLREANRLLGEASRSLGERYRSVGYVDQEAAWGTASIDTIAGLTGDRREESPCPSLNGEAGSDRNLDSQSEVSSIPPSSMPREFRRADSREMDPPEKRSDGMPETPRAAPVGLVTPSTEAPCIAWDALSVIDDSDRLDRLGCHDSFPSGSSKKYKKGRHCSGATSVRSEPGCTWWGRKTAIDWESRLRRQSAGASSVGQPQTWRHRDPKHGGGSVCRDPRENRRPFHGGASSYSDCNEREVRDWNGREDTLKEEYRQKLKHTESTISCISAASDSHRSNDRSVGSETPVRNPPEDKRIDDKQKKKKEGKIPEHMKEEHRELRSKMQASAQQISDGWGSQTRLSTAMAVFEEIPRRIGDDMQRVASHVVDNVQSEVEFMSKMVRQTASSEISSGKQSDRKATEKVVKNLEVIPTMVLNLLEARVEKAKATVRHRISGMIQNLSAIQEEDGEDNDQLVAQMRLISAEVEQIAGDAVEAAAQECYTHKTRQLDFALAALKNPNKNKEEKKEGKEGEEPVAEDKEQVQRPAKDNDWAENWPQTWETMNQQTVPSHAELWPNTVQTSADGCAANMEQAVAVVQDKDYMPHSVTNQVVADELLRAKVRRGGNQQQGWQTQRSDPSVAPNPGSIGHPDLCPRPCLYYASGKCTNGVACGFCHLPHPKRPVRLDKRHRELLKRMPFEELIRSLLPFLKEKAFNQETCDLLDQLENEAYARVGRNFAERGLVNAAGADSAGSAAVLSDWLRRNEFPPKYNPSTSCSVYSFASSNADAESALSARSSTSARKMSGFVRALQVMGSRTLLTTLRNVAPPDAVREKELINGILSMIHDPTEIPEDIYSAAILRRSGASSDGMTPSGQASVASASVASASMASASLASGLPPPGDWSQISSSNEIPWGHLSPTHVRSSAVQARLQPVFQNIRSQIAGRALRMHALSRQS